MITLTIVFFSLILLLGMATAAFAIEWSSDSDRLQHYVVESDVIITGMVVDKEIYDGYEDVWIHVYEPLKDGGEPNIDQAIVRVEVSPAGKKEMVLDTGDEVLLMLTELDADRGYFGLYHPASEDLPKYPITLKNEVLALVGPGMEEDVIQENCTLMDLDGDEFVYCTYEDEESRFYVPILITLENVKQQVLKNISATYFDEHFDLRRAWDVATVNGESTPHGQEIEFGYKLDGYSFEYRVSVTVEDEDLNLRYAPPREISNVVTTESELDSLVYTCLDEGTYYVTHDRVVVNHADFGFSPYISGQGPPEVRDRYGETVREAEKRFVIWPEVGEIDCFEIGQENDVPIESKEVSLLDASEYMGEKPRSNQDNLWMTSIAIVAGTTVAVSATVVWYLRKSLWGRG